MKIVISESQYKRLIEAEEGQKVFNLPSLDFFDYDPFEAWKIIQKIIDKKGNPPYSINGDFSLRGTPIESLGNLQSVGGNLDLRDTPIESLGNLQSVGGNLNLENTPIKSLGNLQSVVGDLYLRGTPIESLGNLQSVGGNLDLYRTPIKSLGNLQSVGGEYLDLEGTGWGKMYNEKQIRKILNVEGDIYL
jgi:hypothetical protein